MDGRDVGTGIVTRTATRARAAACIGLLAGCSKSSAAAPGATGVDAATTVVNGLVGASGGSLYAPDGTGVSVPAGALVVDTTLSLEASPLEPVPTMATIVGTPTLFGPEGIQFEGTVSVTMSYNPQLLPAGSLASDIVVYTAPAGTQAFQALPTSVLDGSHVLTTTTHFCVLVAAVPEGVGAMDGGADAEMADSEAAATADAGDDVGGDAGADADEGSDP